MALIKCKECGEVVSSKADSCPKCGAPFRVRVKGPSGCMMVFLVFLGLLFLFYFMADKGKPEDTKLLSKELPSAQSAPPEKELNDRIESHSADTAAKTTWITGSVKDEMTDANRPYVATTSLNGADFDFPYKVVGGSKASIVIRDDGGKKVAYVAIEKGHMICGYNDCHIVIRDAAGKISNWQASKASPGVTNALFIDNAKAFENLIKKNNKLRIGIEFYKYGVRSFDFDTSDYPGI